MKKLPLFLLLLSGFIACRQEADPTRQSHSEGEPALSLMTEDKPEWHYDHLRLYPIVATADFMQENEAAASLKTLAEVIDDYGFRISEKKPYGRFNDSGAVNNLTVQNKTEDAVFLMGGDIVRGGRQDRVVGEDQIIAARSLRDIPVFCVEQGRWQFAGEAEPENDVAARQDKVFAFSGYYNVASGDIRHTLETSKNQGEVWEKVSRLTGSYQVDSSTGAYASLESSEDFTQKRDAYLHFFSDKFSDLSGMVGIIAVSGDEIIGTDVFGHPDLFQRQLNALLHSYATDATINGSTVQIPGSKLEQQMKKVNGELQNDKLKRYQGAVTHYFVKTQEQ